MKFIPQIAFLVLASTSSWSQTTVTVPAPDGVTITSKANVWSCSQLPSSSLPAGVTVTNGAWSFTNPISAPAITLTGGKSYSPGSYLASIDANGNITWTPYVAPTSGTTLPTTSTAYSVTLPAVAGIASEMTASVTLKIPGITAVLNTVTTGPVVVPPGGNWDWEAYISAPGIVTIQVRNKTWAAVNFPSTVFTVKVQ